MDVPLFAEQAPTAEQPFYSTGTLFLVATFSDEPKIKEGPMGTTGLPSSGIHIEADMCRKMVLEKDPSYNVRYTPHLSMTAYEPVCEDLVAPIGKLHGCPWFVSCK